MVCLPKNPCREVPDSRSCAFCVEWSVAGGDDVAAYSAPTIVSKTFSREFARMVANQKPIREICVHSRLSLRGRDFRRKRSCDHNDPLISTSMLNRDLHIPLAAETLELFAPLDQQDTAAIHQIVERKGIEFALGIDAVEVDVEESDLGSAVFVDESKRRTGDAVGLRRLKALGNALYQRGLPCPQIAAQEDHAAGLECRGQLPSQCDGLFGGVRRVLLGGTGSRTFVRVADAHDSADADWAARASSLASCCSSPIAMRQSPALIASWAAG